MSGPYSAGSNVVVPGQLTSTSGTLAPTGFANSGSGTISSVAQLTSGTTIAGVFYVQVVDPSTHMGNNLQITGSIINPPTANPITDLANIPVGPSQTITLSNLGFQFNILNSTSTSGTFALNDGFIIYTSEVGQNSDINALEQTGVSVTVQQFQSVPFSGAPATWGAVIQAMFNYCGANPGVVGIIPPGFYDCSDATSGLQIVSNMTISAYGAVLFTSVNALNATTPPSDYGFLTVASPAAAIVPGTATAPSTGIHNVTIKGGTWGGAGLNGATCTDNTALYPTTSRLGSVVSLFVDHDLTLIDVTVRGWSSGWAFYLYCNSNLTVENCSFWNSDGMARSTTSTPGVGTGGIRIANGTNIRVSNSTGICGDDCLQFSAPELSQIPNSLPHNTLTTLISNAYFLGGNVESLNARPIAVTLQSGFGTTSSDKLTTSILDIGFSNIIGTCAVTSATTATAVILNPNSTGIIKDVTINSCKLTGPSASSAGTTVTTHQFWVENSTHIGTIATRPGGISDIYVSDVSFINPTAESVFLNGFYNSNTGSMPPVPPYIGLSNVNFTDCLFYAPPNPPASVGRTLTATGYVQSCIGYSFRNCSFYAAGAPCLALGMEAGAPHEVANYGVIDGCTFYSNNGTNSLVSVMTGDMNAIQGWSKFFAGAVPVVGASTVAPASGINIESSATNTFIDCVDFRGLLTSPPVTSANSTTRLGTNIVTTAGYSAGGLRLSKTGVAAPSGTSTVTWPQNAMVLEFNSGASSGGTLVLPNASNDGEVRVLASSGASYTSLSITPTVPGLPVVVGVTTVNILPASGLRLIWDASGGFWFAA